MQPAQRVRPQATQPAGEREAGRRDGPVHGRPLHRRADRRDPGRRSQRGDERALRPAVDVVPGGTADHVRQRRAHRVQVRGDPPQRGPVRGDGAGQHVAQPVEPRSGGRRHGQHRHVRQAVVGQQPPDVGHGVRDVRGGEPVDLVEHHDHHVAVPGERPQVAVVDRGVGVLLRVEHPHQQVDQLDQPVDLEPVRHLGRVVVGQVEQHEPAQVVLRFPGVPCGGSRASRAAGPRRRHPQTQPRAPTPVVGRRTPGSETCAPASALNSDDLPLPVAPASATTVCVPDSRRRSPARRDSSRAGASSASSSRPSPSSTTRSRARSRRGDGLRGVVGALGAPPGQERHRASSTACRRALQRLGVAGVGGVRGEQVGEPATPRRRAGRRPARAGRRGPRRPAAGRPGRRTAPRAPSGTAASCRRRPRPRRRWG